MSAIDAAENSLVSPRQFGKYSDDDLADSPPRPTMGAADHLGEQFQGIVGPDRASHSVNPPAELDLGYDAEADAQDWRNDLASRHPHYIGEDDDAPSVHEYLSGNRSRRDHAS